MTTHPTRRLGSGTCVSRLAVLLVVSLALSAGGSTAAVLSSQPASPVASTATATAPPSQTNGAADAGSAPTTEPEAGPSASAPPATSTAVPSETDTTEGAPASATEVAPSPSVAAQGAVSPTASGSPTAEGAAITYEEKGGGGGGKNAVVLVNRTDGRLRIKANIQLNRIPGPMVEPVNQALAYASCTDCQTIAVAMQVNLISRSARKVTPQNAAVAVNVRCTRCRTAAIALQYVYSVDDPTAVPKEVRDLIKEMDRELNAIAREPNMTLPDAVARIDAVIARFSALAESLNDQRDEATESTTPGATPIAEPEPSPDATGSARSTTPIAAAQPVVETAPTASAAPQG